MPNVPAAKPKRKQSRIMSRRRRWCSGSAMNQPRQSTLSRRLQKERLLWKTELLCIFGSALKGVVSFYTSLPQMQARRRGGSANDDIVAKKRNGWNEKKQRYLTPFWEHMARSGVAKVSALLIIVLLSGVYLFPSGTQGATYSFSQTSWAGGATANTATHTSNQSGWTEYASKDSGLSAVNSGADLELGLTAVSATQSSDTDFSAGTLTDTAVSGSGASGSVGLTATTASPTWTSLTSSPAASNDGAVSTGDDYIYVLRGNNTSTFYRYSISGNSWTTMTGTPGVVDGGALVYPGSGDYIYALRGNNIGSGGNAFYRYSISGNSWTTMAVTPSDVNGTSLVYPGSGDYIYAFQGWGTTGFYRYSISGNSWTTMTAIPLGVNYGALVYPGSGDYIYALRGWGYTGFYRYSISGNSWTTMTAVPVATNGGALVYPGSGDYLYALPGNAYTNFYRYSISGNSWTTISGTIGDINKGALVYPGSGNYLYALQGSNTGFYRYDISADTGWSSKTAAPGTISSGGALVYPGSGDYIYGLKGGYDTGFYRYSISGNSWSAMTAVPGNMSRGGALVYPGSGDYIYAIGNFDSKNVFYRYSISGNSWTSMTSIPGSGVDRGGALVYPGSGDYIYALSGWETTGFYRYSISGNSWATMTAAPAAVSYGGSLVYPGSGDYIYAFSGGISGSTGFYRYSISGNSWATMTAAPAAVYDGGALSYPGSGDYIYALRGNGSANFYRYSISGNSWTAMTATSGTIGSGGALVYTGSKLYAFRGASTTDFYAFSLTSYLSSGTFESSAMDLTAAASFSTLAFGSTLPSGAESSCTASTGSGCALKFQVAANTDNATWNYVGPDNTASTYFTATGETIPAALTNDRYFRYKAYLATADTGVTPTLDSLTVNYNQYPSSQTLTSSVYDSSSAVNLLSKLTWTATGTSGTETVQFQVRSASTSGGLAAATWCGYEDCSGSSYFDAAESGVALSSLHPLMTGADDQYFQYKVILSSAGLATPTLGDVTAQYVVNAAPAFDTSFGTNGITVAQISDSADPDWGKVRITYKVRDTDTTDGTSTPGYVTPSFAYSTGAGFTTIAAPSIAAGSLTNKAVDVSTYTEYSAIWDAPTDIPDTYTAALQVRVTVNDNEAANNTATATDTIAFDSKDPVLGGVPIIVDASTVPATITFSATDDSSLQMKVGLNADLSGASYVTYASSATVTLVTNPDTVYGQFRDAYGNATVISSASSTETPSLVMIQDISNTSTSEWRLFASWQTVSEPAAGFANYKLYRSTDNVTYSLLATIAGRTVNYYIDSSAVFDTTYYYKIKMTDNNGNVSWFSSTLTGKANGTQDSGEGGGGSETTPPTISGVSSASISTTQATILWDTDELADSTVGFSTTAGVFTDEIGVANFMDSASGNGRHQVVLSGLTPDTAYYYRVISSDPSGNEAIDNNGGNGYTFTTLDGPAISGVALSGAANTQATITWNTDIASNTYVNYSTSVSGGALVSPLETGDSTLVTAHSITLTGLSSGTSYFFSVKSTDISSNLATDNNAGDFYSFTTTTDSTGPVLASITASVTTDDKAVLTWTSDEQADSQIRYSLTAGGPYTATPASATYSEAHYVILSSLVADTTYYYRAVSSDLSGNQTISSESSFATLQDPEYQHDPLSSVTSVSASLVTDTNAVISLTTDQPALCTVEYGTTPGSYAATPVAETLENREHRITLSSLLFSTTYYYQVSCEDNLENTVVSDEENFTTTEEQANSGDAPVISGISADSVTGESVTITWDTDKLSNSLVYYGAETFDEHVFGAGTVNADEANYVTAHSVKIDRLLPGTKYLYKVSSIDTSGRSALSAEDSFTTEENPFFEGISASFSDEGQAVIAWTTGIATDSVVEYGEKIGSYSSVKKAASKTKEHSITLSSLKEGATYYYRIKGTDGDGTVWVSAGNSFLALSPPTLSGLDTETDETSATVSFRTNRDTSATVILKDGDEEAGGAGSSEPDNEHSLKVSNLKPGTSYDAIITIVDPERRSSRETALAFETKEDKKAPIQSDVKIETALQTDARVQTVISFTTDEPARTTLLYKKGRGGEEKELPISTTESKTHMVLIKSFDSGAIYFFRTKAIDASGNENLSDEHALTTPRKKENVIQVISKNLWDIFGWAAAN